MPSLWMRHNPPWCNGAAHRDGTFWAWLRWFFATVKCYGPEDE